MKAFRTLVTILVLGAIMALGTQHLRSAHAVQPPAGIVALALMGGLPVCAADTNDDQQVNSADLSVLLGQFGTNVTPGTGADFNNDGVVNSADLSVLLAAFGLACVECNIPGDCAAPPNMVASCVGGDCEYACAPGYLNCNASLVDGCEIDSTTDIAHCGACNNACAFANGVAACINGVCTLAGCNPGFGNCDGNPANGCETNTNNSLTHCGSCNAPCNLPNANEQCINGVCTLLSCNPGFANCDGNPANGCEVNVGTSLTNCGSCGTPCDLPNASEQCVNGVCTLVACQPDYSNCDGISANGCEVIHWMDANTCSTAEVVGSICGDFNCGFLCPPSDWSTLATRSGRTGRWFRVRIVECAGCLSDVGVRVTLNVPSGTDYDLHAYMVCNGAQVASSTASGSVTDSFTFTRDDVSSSDESFDLYIHVRHWDGSSCTNWTLTIEGTDC